MKPVPQLLLSLLFCVMTLSLMGIDSCKTNTADDDDDSAVVEPQLRPPTPDELKAILTGVKETELAIIKVAMNSEHPDFDGCMIATGTICGLDAIIDSTDSVASEMENPDGKFDISGCKFDATKATGTGCEEIKPDPWPRVDPSGWADKARVYADLGFNTTELILIQSIPNEGKGCTDGHIVLGAVKAAHQLTDNALTQGAQGSFIFDVPTASMDYSICKDVPKEEVAPEGAEEPTEATNEPVAEETTPEVPATDEPVEDKAVEEGAPAEVPAETTPPE